MKNLKKQSKPSEKKHKGITFNILARLKKKSPKRHRKIIFNMLFLRKMRKKHGPLHCVYCGKHVEICPIGGSVPVSILATADHFLPTATHPELEFEESNLRVACCKCNTKKSDQLWDEKFPYKEKEDGKE